MAVSPVRLKKLTIHCKYVLGLWRSFVCRCSPVWGHPWVLYEGQCYLAGTQGPCQKHMKLFLLNGTKSEGKCDCECFHSENFGKKHCHLAKQFVHVAKVKNQCFPLFHQVFYYLCTLR